MEYVIRFAISLFDLAVFMYYFHSNKKMKPVSKVWILAGFTIAAIIWTFVSSIKNPYLNLATLLIVLILLSFYYESGMWTRIINIVTFMGIGMLFEPVALLLLHAMNFHVGESYKYYFVMVICSFVRGNVMYVVDISMELNEIKAVMTLAAEHGISINAESRGYEPALISYE